MGVSVSVSGVSVPVWGGRGGLCPGDLCPGGSLLRWGSLSRGFSVQGDLCPGGLSRGVSVQGGLSKGFSVLRGLSGGFSVKGGSLSEGSLSRGSLYGNEWVVRILLECILYPSVSVSV